MNGFAGAADQNVWEVSHVEVFTVFNQRFVAVKALTDHDERTTHGSPHQLERLVKRHERDGLADVGHNAPILGRSVAWRVFGASKGRCDFPLGEQGRPGTSNEAHFQYAHGSGRRGAALVAGCGRARIGLGHFGL
jgi:hypothetical protein